ncbi:MAG: ABC transporter permease [Clostridiales bacterium]|nr:ABC transporter permease [Clostridiales bacterium]
MAYILPVVYVVVSYTFFLLAGFFDNTMELQIFSILLPFIMGIINLIVVLTAGKKWSRKTLLNCTLIIKYGLIPFYLLGGSITVYVTMMALFPLLLMALFGLVTIVFLIFGYGILLGSAPYAISYLIKSRKDGVHPKWLAILGGICQFFFSFDVLAMMVLTLKERHRVKTTLAIFCAMFLAVLTIILYAVVTLIST